MKPAELVEVAEQLEAAARRLRDLTGNGVLPGDDVAAGDGLVDARTMAKLTGKPLTSIYRCGRRGELGAVRIGRSMLFSLRRFREWVENGGSA